MGNQNIPARADIFKMNQLQYQAYYDTITGYQKTNTHNLYINIITESGIIGIAFLVNMISLFLSKILFTPISDHNKVVGICGLTSLLVYGLFQITPLSFPFFIFFFRILDLGDS